MGWGYPDENRYELFCTHDPEQLSWFKDAWYVHLPSEDCHWGDLETVSNLTHLRRSKHIKAFMQAFRDCEIPELSGKTICGRSCHVYDLDLMRQNLCLGVGAGRYSILAHAVDALKLSSVAELEAAVEAWRKKSMKELQEEKANGKETDR